MAKKKEENRVGENFVVKFPLMIDKWQEDIFNKRFYMLGCIYNDFQRKMIKHYRYISQMDAFRNCKTKAEKSKFLAGYKVGINNKSAAYGTFSEFGMISNMAPYTKKYQCVGINSSILSTMASFIWSSWKKKLYENGKRVSLKRNDDVNFYNVKINSMGGFVGIDIKRISEGKLGIKLNGKNGRLAKMMWVDFIVNDKSDYEMYAFKNKITGIGFKREKIRGRYKYYVMFTFEGVKPSKNRTLGNGKVGIDIGPSTYAISSNNKIIIDELSSDVQSIENEKRRIMRKIDRSRRANNPEMFNEDGTIKKRPNNSGKRDWVNSNRYLVLKDKLTEIHRRQANARKLSHIMLANEVLGLGNEFIVEKNPVSAWAKKSRETKVKRNGKFASKKRYGKSIANRAPSMFITILENKVKSLGGTLKKIDIKNAASQFDFTNGECTKHKLNERRVTLSNGDTHLRDTMAAFNLQHFGDDKYDTDTMNSDYAKFSRNEEIEIERHKRSGKKICKNFGII